MRMWTTQVPGALALLALTATARSSAAVNEPRVALAVETLENTLDGSELRGCLVRGDVETGKTHRAWISFGAVQSQADGGWETIAPRTDCGSGSFDKAGAQTVRTFGAPYLIVDLEDGATILPGGRVGLDASLLIRKLSGFDHTGRPVYTSSVTKRTLDLGADDETIVPLLVADQREKDAFKVHEVFLRLTARVAGQQPPVAYGIVSVTGDVPGIDIFLDGGLVGRTSERGPTTLKNVLTGKREVRARDFSGREARTSVVVEKDRTADVSLKVLNLPTAPPVSLQPIGKNPQGHEEYWRGQDAAVVVRVPAGEFLMGSPEGEGEALERPRRLVYVSDFLIDKTEVTWRQFEKFAKATGTPLPPSPLWRNPDDYPVVNVLWDEAKAYCEWVGGRLPTEAEWEKAARGTDGRKYPWGNDWDPDRCNSIDGGPHRPEAVGRFPNCISPYGAIDMAGSAWEWCADWYAEGYDAEGSSSRDPQGPTTGQMRVLRGGYWMSQPNWVRAAYRTRNDPAARNVHYGFRCAQDAAK